MRWNQSPQTFRLASKNWLVEPRLLASPLAKVTGSCASKMSCSSTKTTCTHAKGQKLDSTMLPSKAPEWVRAKLSDTFCATCGAGKWYRQITTPQNVNQLWQIRPTPLQRTPPSWFPTFANLGWLRLADGQDHGNTLRGNKEELG